MFEVTTNWMPCGARKRRAHISAPSEEAAAMAREFYDETTTRKLDVIDRMDRAIAMFNRFGATTRHEYDPA